MREVKFDPITEAAIQEFLIQSSPPEVEEWIKDWVCRAVAFGMRKALSRAPGASVEEAAEEYSGVEFGRWCNNGRPSVAGARREELRDAFLAGAKWQAAHDGMERLKEINAAVSLIRESEKKLSAARAEALRFKEALEKIAVAQVQRVMRNEHEAFMIDGGYVKEAREALRWTDG